MSGADRDKRSACPGFLAPFFIGGALALVFTLLRVGDVGLLVSAADGLFASGVLFLGTGALVFVYKCGFFDIFSFSLRALVSRFRGGSVGDYTDYTGRQRRCVRVSGIIASGALYFALSMLASAAFILL